MTIMSHENMIVEFDISRIIVKDRYRDDKGDIPTLAESIKNIGLIQPITVDDKNRLIAGERRLLAHKHLGLEKIKAIVRPSKGEIDALEVELLENVARKDMTWQEICKLEKAIWDLKSKKGKWTQQQQSELLKTNQGDTSRHIRMAEALEMIPDLAERVSFDDAWKEYKKIEEGFVTEMMAKKRPETIKKAAQWAQDHYKVGDAFEGMAKCRDELVHFAEIDPPYGVDLDKRKGRNKVSGMDEYNEVDADEYVLFYEKVAAEVYRILKPDSFAVFWYGWDWHSDVMGVLRKVGFRIPTIPAIWNKGLVGQTASPDTTLGSCHEPFFLARKGTPKLKKPGRGNVFSFSPVSPSSKIHPTERPVDLMEEVINTCLFPGSVILVPFLGSGATLRAAYRTGHTGFGWDLSEEHKKRFLKKVADETEEPKDE